MKVVTPALLVLVVMLGGCGGEPRTERPPRSHLGDHPATTTPVMKRVGQTATRLEMRAAFPANTGELWVSADCSGGGKQRLDVSISPSGLGGAGFGCERAGSGGTVVLGQGPGELDGGVHSIVVTAPEGATWSLTIDAR